MPRVIHLITTTVMRAEECYPGLKFLLRHGNCPKQHVITQCQTFETSFRTWVNVQEPCYIKKDTQDNETDPEFYMVWKNKTKLVEHPITKTRIDYKDQNGNEDFMIVDSRVCISHVSPKRSVTLR